MEARICNNQQNIPLLENHFETLLGTLQLKLEGSNVMLAPWILDCEQDIHRRDVLCGKQCSLIIVNTEIFMEATKNNRQNIS